MQRTAAEITFLIDILSAGKYRGELAVTHWFGMVKD
jgi:hypothetical protein